MGSSVIQNNFRARKSFAKIGKIIDIPNLIDIQKQSYEKFLQKDVPLDKREDVGLQGVFKSVNVDGYEVLAFEAEADTVRLNIKLLKTQFELKP